MKKYISSAIKCSVALVATVGFVSCSSDDVAEFPVNPTYNGNSVKAQFAINIATPSTNPGTRMGAEETQNANNFLGMTNIALFPITLGSGSPHFNTPLRQYISLPNIGSEITASSSNKIYSDVEIPVGTDNFLFYALGRVGTDDVEYPKYGFLKTDYGTANVEDNRTAGNLKFSLRPILSSPDNITAIESCFIEYLNSIKNVAGWSTTSDVTLLNAYQGFTKDKKRCGSANAVLKTVERLYNVVEDADDNNNNVLVQAIQTAITGNANIEVVVDNSSSIGTSGGESNTLSSVTLKYKENSSHTDGRYNFPLNFGLPEGSAQLTHVQGTGFQYDNQPSFGTSGSTMNMYGICYPPCLAYSADTPLRATNVAMELSSWPSTPLAWETFWKSSGEGNSWGNAVNASTQSVALQNNVNYGVALLKTSVRCVSGTLWDNKSIIANDGSSDQEITVPEEGFPVSAVLVGGQPSYVGWQFVSESSATADRSAVVYDHDKVQLNAKNVSTSDNYNYTLLLDNWNAADVGQDEVMMAIELTNNTDQEIYGVDGVIAVGQKFYLIAKIALNEGTTTEISWPASDYRYPKSGTKRVFMQDYTTTANLKITTLKNAYSTIPDLRSTRLNLGLSVDLTWRSGLTFDVDIQ